MLNHDALGAMKQRVVLVAALAACALMLAALPVTLPHGDFDEYWAAGRLNAGGRNPYDAAAMLQEQRLNGWPESRPVMMYNPPWTLALVRTTSWTTGGTESDSREWTLRVPPGGTVAGV